MFIRKIKRKNKDGSTVTYVQLVHNERNKEKGYSKDKRPDLPSRSFGIIGLAVTRTGIPVKHWIFPGNTQDMETIKIVKAAQTSGCCQKSQRAGTR